MRDADAITIRLFAPEDLAALESLVRACYGDAAEPGAWWTWRHFGLPSARGRIFLATLGDRIVGMRPVSFFGYSLAGRPLRGALLSAVMVHPDYRRLGIFSRLVKTCIDAAWAEGADFATTMPNDLSYPGFIKLGWRDPGDRLLMVRPTDVAGAARSRMHPGIGWWLAALPSQAAVATVSLALDVAAQRLDVSIVDSFGSDTDDLADRISSGSGLLETMRDKQWLDWRYAGKEWNEYLRYEARSSDGRLAGIAVTNKEKRKGLEIGYIVELTGDSGRARRALASRTVRDLKKLGAHAALAVVSDRASTMDLLRLGFVPIPKRISPKRFHTVYLPRPGMEDVLSPLDHIRNWHQTLGDWDGI